MARSISGRGKDGKQTAGDFRPTREAILQYIAENPDRAGRRDIAKAFSLRNDDRAWLKDQLRELEDTGQLQRDRKQLGLKDALPTMAVLDIFGRDDDGNLLARPQDEDGPADTLVLIRNNRGGKVAGVGDRVLAKTFRSKTEGPAYTGRNVKVFEKRKDTDLGVLRELPDGTLRIEPVERRQAEMLVDPQFTGGAKPGDLVEVETVRSARYGLAQAKVLTVLGSLTNEKAVSMIAIHAHDIPYVFPSDVLAEAQSVKSATMAGREDWRNLPLITIDPADAKDHDDAVFGEPDPDIANPGGVIVTVAIADVAAYVRPNTPLDREALRRGNSVYFPDRVVPMLPERISNDLCSLREKAERPALGVRMTFDASGRKLRHTFHRVMIRSAARLAYPQAQAAIDGRPDDATGPILETILKPLWDAYAVLKCGRQNRKPLELDLPERKILLKPDGTVDQVVVPDRLDAHKLIEEMMIQANVAAAETLEAKRQGLVYRIHDAPSLAKQESLREFLQTVGLSLARGPQLTPAMFNSILERVRGHDQEALINEVVLRSQSQAEYNPDNIGHFGLNLRKYAHFTSPIRRYADLIVHRALIKALNLGPDGLTAGEEERLAQTAGLISATERRAMAAERDTVDRLIAGYLSEKINEMFKARVSGVTSAGLFVQLSQFGADGFIPISTLGDEYFHFDEGARSVVGERSGRGYRLADEVDVRLVEVAPMAGAMRFEMLSEPQPVPGSRRSFHKSGRSGRNQARQRASQPRSTRKRR
jgi:ribonuclease R